MPRFLSVTTWSVLFIALLAGLNAGHAMAHGDEDHGQDGIAAKPALIANAVMAKTPGILNIETVAARRLPDGSLFVPKGVQHQIGLRHAIATIHEMTATAEFNGRIIADPNAGGRVQADQPGRIEVGAHGMPVLGQKVVRGQALAMLRPTASSMERGSQRAQLAEVEAQLAIAEKKHARYEQLEGAVASKEIEAARIEVESLRQRRAAVGASVDAALPLRAPVSGVIAATHVVPGQVVEAREILFEVIDPTQFAVEALAYDPALANAIAKTASIPLPGGALALRFVGAGRLLRDQAMPLLFRIQTRDAPVAIGQPVKVIAQTTLTHTGALLPRAALVKTSAGETAVWVRDGAERFSLRRVSVESHDALTVAAITGVREGERVVTVGAGLLSQVR